MKKILHVLFHGISSGRISFIYIRVLFVFMNSIISEFLMSGSL